MRIPGFTPIIGFTLIELLIIVIIIGVLAANVGIKMQSPQIQVLSQAQQIGADIRYAQAISMATNSNFRFARLSTTTYQIQDQNGAAVALANGATTVTLGRNMTFGTFTNLPNSSVTFDGLGIPYTNTAATTALAAIATIPVVSSTGGTITISLSPLTGWMNI